MPIAALKRLDGAGTGEGGGILLLTEKAEIEKVAEYVVQGNVAQLGDRRFITELTAWVRFNSAEAMVAPPAG